MADVGGVAGFDMLNNGIPVALRYKVRHALGLLPSLKAGAIGRYGLTVPLSYQEPFNGHIDVSWLHGFCMIYRRTAIDGLQFDEGLPTYGGEDSEFSKRVSRKWRLVLCGDLRLEHHHSVIERPDQARVSYEVGFGSARSYVSQARGMWGILLLGWCTLLELTIDLASLVRSPTRKRLCQIVAKQIGCIRGALSVGQSHAAAEKVSS
jgi:hypothetical protein